MCFEGWNSSFEFEGAIWKFQNLHLCSSVGVHARETKSPLEHELQAPRSFMSFTDRSSEGMCARATLHNLHVRSSEDSYARAWTLFSENLTKCSNSCFGILIAS